MNSLSRRKKIDAILESMQAKNISKEDAAIQLESLGQFNIQDTFQNQVEKFSKKIHDQLSSNFGQVAFSQPGFNSSLSLFRDFKTEESCILSDNLCAGSHWQNALVDYFSVVSKNAFSAVQLSEVDINRSELTSNQVGFCRLSHFELDGSGMHDCKLQRSTLSDFTMLDSMLQKSKIHKSSISNLNIRSSRLTSIEISNSSFTDLEISECQLFGVSFVNCQFRDCSFENVVLKGNEAFVVENINASGISVSNVSNAEAFLSALKQEKPKPVSFKPSHVEPTLENQKITKSSVLNTTRSAQTETSSAQFETASAENAKAKRSPRAKKLEVSAEIG